MIKVNELFSGIGAFRKAMERLEIPHEIVGISEIDKYAIKSYEAIYGATRNYGDISKVDKLDYADLWTYGFPCQDISVAGQLKGIVRGETRSGLLYEVQRLLVTSAENNELPKYLILENVKNLVGKKFKSDFYNWLEWLACIGYNNYWQVINAKDCGIPQNRERVFVVSIRKDIDRGFSFPQPIPLATTMADFLEDEVDEKFYITGGYIASLKKNVSKDTSKPCALGHIPYPRSDKPHQSNTFFDTNAVSPTLDTCEGGNRQVKIIVASRGRNPENPSNRTVGIKTEQRLEPNSQGICNTLTSVLKDNYVAEPMALDEQTKYIRINGTVGKIITDGSSPKHNEPNCLIRKLTPKEYWRLMGFDDSDFEKAEKVCSNSQLYKQAGNSIVVNVLNGILNELLG